MTAMIATTLNDVCRLVTDGTHDTPKRVQKGFPLVKAKEIVGGWIDFDTCDQISYEDHLKVISRSKPESGDILFAHIGASLGETAFIKTLKEFSIKNIALFKPDPMKVDNRYLYYYVINSRFQEEIKSIKTGSAQPFVGLGTLRNHTVEIHKCIETQRKIASILSSYDDLIENNTRRIKILEEMARNVYREWFVNFRFPGHEQVKMVDSPLGMIPEGWEVKALGNLAKVNADSIKKKSEPETINYVDIASVSTGRIEKIEMLSFAEAPGRARRIVKHGDVIWSMVRPNRRSYAMVLKPVENMIVSTGFAVLSAASIPFTYLYHAATTDDFVGYLTNHATGAAYPAVNAGDFENATILVPPRELLDKFHLSAESIVIQCHKLQQKNQNLRQTRDLLLPKLISGEVAV